MDSLEGYLSALENKQLVATVYVASAAILVYDLILTFHLEISLVWFARWNYTKVLYLLVRYIPFAANALTLCNLLLPGAFGSTCANMFKAAGSLYFVGLTLAEVILMIRTWACWGRNKRVGLGLALWISLCQIPSGIFLNKFLASLRFGSPLPDPRLNSCFVLHSNRLMWVNWFVLLLGEGIVLSLMVVFAYRTSRNGNTPRLIRVIYRDGLAFYVYLFCVTSINIALTLTLDNSFVAMVAPFQSAIHSSLTTRIVLNIREAASQRRDDFSFNLHMSDANFHVPGSRISFAENPAVFHSNEDREDAISLRRRRPDSASTAQTGVVPIPNSTAPHVTPPMTQDDERERMAGLSEPGGGSDDGKDLMRTSPDQCM